MKTVCLIVRDMCLRPSRVSLMMTTGEDLMIFTSTNASFPTDSLCADYSTLRAALQ